MTEPLNIQEAAVAALGAFLQTQFDQDPRFSPPEVPEQRCLVLPEWPAGNLPPRALSILCAGERRDTRVQPELVKATQLPNNQGEFTWLHKMISQQLQLDVWATTDLERGMILNALDRFLNMGPFFTLGAGELIRDGLLLRLDPGTGHEGFADFSFDGPNPVNDRVAVHECEFRALIRGQVEAGLTFTARTARLARLKFQALLDANTFTFGPGAPTAL